MTNKGTNEEWGMDDEPQSQQMMNAGRRTTTTMTTPTHDEWGDDNNDPRMGTMNIRVDKARPQPQLSPRTLGARTNYEVVRCCKVLIDNDVNVWRAKEELSVRVMV